MKLILLKVDMKFFKIHFISLFFIINIFLIGQCYSQSITVTGQWLLFITIADLQGGPGSDLINTYTSAINQVEISVVGGQFDRTWAVYIQRQDINWDASLHLDAQAVHSKIIDGNRQEITTNNEYFFRSNNKKNCNNIDVQYWLWGVSVANLSSGSYTTTIYYTLIDL